MLLDATIFATVVFFIVLMGYCGAKETTYTESFGDRCIETPGCTHD